MTLKDPKHKNLKEATNISFEATLVDTKKENLSRNLYFEDNILKTRPGTTLDNTIIFNSQDTGNNFERVIFTDCYYYKDNQKGRFIVVVDNDEISNIKYHFHLVFPSGESIYCSFIEFIRASDDVFGIPENFTLYAGKKTRGSGIYLIVRKVYGNDLEDMAQLYELNEDMNGWLFLQTSDFYVPTVLAFGRGTQYYLAEEEGKVSLSKPVKLEDDNLLTTQFVAYYSTDGYSSYFEMPCEKLGDEPIRCVYKNLLGEYEFIINSKESRSNTVEVEDKQITMYCNRSLGIISFRDEYNAAAAFSFYGIENNLCFTAFRQADDEILELAAMSRSIEIPSGREGEGRQTVVLYGNMLSQGGKLQWINSENPLYFPKSCTVTPGKIKNRICGGFFFENKLYVFDNEKIYTGSIKLAESIDLTSILKGYTSANKEFFDQITFNKATALPEEVITDSVAVMPDRVLFAGQGGGIYEMSASANGIKMVADLSCFGFSPTFAVTYKGGYVLFNKKEAYYYHPTKKYLSFWEIISTVIGGFSSCDECVLIAQYGGTNGRAIVNPLYFDGKMDLIVIEYDMFPVCGSSEVESEFVCGFDNDSVFNKRLYAVEIEVTPSVKEASVELFADNEKIFEGAVTFKDGICTIRYGAMFKALKLKLKGEQISFLKARLVYYDSTTF